MRWNLDLADLSDLKFSMTSYLEVHLSALVMDVVIGSSNGMIVQNNTVNASGGYYYEAGGFPLGTRATDKVLDDLRELTGITTNTVVGH